ncbi:phage major capsid protein [Microbacterium sp. NIBRBAC000506063]|uniref:phage major capsid protein n=1 Tax=Microbacterium sp. NIBRBAC000506063 TaxID=2734618 RepID=UPI001BB650E9|nr:phage major capsid protein [Microbacterium sp. NIBRBAC000506063]QTV79480.1 phage major capsid protein [Microbacterium sp. NIBRBAC000506063]
MTTTLEEQMRAELKAARDISLKYGDGDIEGDDLAAVTKHLKAYQDLKVQFEKGKESDDVKARLDAIGFDLGLERTPEQEAQAKAFRQPSKLKSIGQMFVESAEYKGLMSQFGGGHINEKARVQSSPFGIKGLVTGGSDTSGGAFVENDQTGIYEPLGRRPLTIRDLVSVRQTESDTVEYVRQTVQLASAAPVPEATSAAAPTVATVEDGEDLVSTVVPNPGGGYKPEGSLAFEKVTATVKTIAEWIPATKRGLADAKQLRGLIDDELRADLAEEEEDQILNGNGSGENFTGILNTSGTQAQAYSATVADLNPLIETTLKAKTKVRTGGRSIPTGYVLNPADWEIIQLARLAKNPNNEATAGAVQTLHGLPVVESEAIPAGTGLTGDFRKAVIWDREQASITATDSHADFFIRNLVAILGEERLAFGVTRPTAFVEIDLTA